MFKAKRFRCMMVATARRRVSGEIAIPGNDNCLRDYATMHRGGLRGTVVVADEHSSLLRIAPFSARGAEPSLWKGTTATRISRNA